MAKKATEALDEIERIVREFGDCDLEMPDGTQVGWYNPVDRIEFDSDRQAIQVISDR